MFFKENSSLSAIEKIVEKFFRQTKKPINKKRLLSQQFGTSVTGIDELALTSIKKKKTKAKHTATTEKKASTSQTTTEKSMVVSNSLSCSGSKNYSYSSHL